MTSIRAVERALRLLAELDESPHGARLSELARAVELAPSSTARLLATLEAVSWVRRDSGGRYQLGLQAISLGLATLQATPLVELARPHLEELAQSSGESANLAVPVDGSALYLHQVPSARALRHASWVGRSVPLQGTAIGAALEGRTGPEDYVATRKTVEPDVTAVAAPIRGRVDGTIIAGLSITGPTFRLSDEDVAACGRALVVHAAALSHLLDGRSSYVAILADTSGAEN